MLRVAAENNSASGKAVLLFDSTGTDGESGLRSSSFESLGTLPDFSKLDRPLTHQEMIQRWCQTLAKREAIRAKFEAVQQEFDDYASDIIDVIGYPTYSYFLAPYLAAPSRNCQGGDSRVVPSA